MKLAEALVLRADLQKRLAQLRNRLLLNAKVQAGETAAEDPNALLAELDACARELETLIARINHTNARTLDAGESLCALLARRDVLRLTLDTLRAFVSEAGATVLRGTKSEIVIKSTVSVPEQQKRVDARAKELRELEMRIQSLNWTTELS